MFEKKVSQRYARALYGLAAEKNKVDEAYQDLKDIKLTVEDSREFELFLFSPIIKPLKKSKIFHEIFDGKISELTFKFFDLLIKKQREKFIMSILNEFSLIYNEKHNIAPITVTTAVEIGDELKAKINKQMEQITNMSILPSFVIEPNIKGGIKIQIDDQVFDQTIASKLQKIHTELEISE